MHLATLLTFAASASTLATARLDRRASSHSNRPIARSHPSTLDKRAPAPEPFRYFAAGSADASGSFEARDGVVALRKRGGDEARADLARRARAHAKLFRRKDSDSTVYQTTAVWMSETGWQGVCGETVTDDSYVIGLPLGVYPDPSAASSRCGSTVTVTAKSTGKTIQAKVYGGSDRDAYTTFSKGAYLALGGDLDAGVLDVEFSFASATETKDEKQPSAKPVAEAVVKPAATKAEPKVVEAKVETTSKTDNTAEEDKAAAKKAAKAAEKADKAAEKQAAADQAASDKAASDKAAAEQKAADKAAANKIEAEREARKAAAEQEKADAAAAKKAEEEKDQEAEEQKKQEKKVADTSSGTKLAVANTGKGKSLIGFHSDNCGSSGATEDEPNGSESFLNCGISKSDPWSGWKPPSGVTLDHITTVSIEQALATNHVWEPCRKFTDMFETVATENDLPPILLAAFALQESTCNPDVLGDGGGAFGLFQITQDKCGGRGAKDCAEPWYNARTAAKYFKTELANHGGEFLKALGAYNGWYADLSYKAATAAAYSGCCECQQNLDYLYQMTNGWLLGRTGYELGSYKNLAVCSNQD